MTITFGAHASAGSSDGNTATTPARNVPDGATIGAIVSWGPENAADATLTDNAGNTYLKTGNTLGPNTGGYGNRGMMYRCENCIGNAALVLVATRSGAYPSVAYQAVLGNNPTVESIADGSVDTASPYTSPSVSPVADGAAILSGFVQNGSGTTTATAGPSPLAVVEQVTDTNSFYPVHLAAGVQTTAAAIAASWTCTGGPGSGFAWTMVVSESGGSPVTGSVEKTLGAVTSAAASAVAVAAATVAILGALVCSAAGEQPLAEDTGTVNATLGAVSLVASANATTAGGLTTSLGPASLSSTGAAAVNAGMSATLRAATLAATNIAVTGPTIGGHTLAWDHEGSGSDPHSSDPITTVSGSTLLVPVLVANALDVAPTDNYGNAFTRYGSRINYTQWSGYGLSVWRATNINGGANHIVTVQKDIAPAAEITMNVIEVRNAVSMAGSVSEELINDPLITAPVTTTGPSLLISLWSGDSSAGPMTAVAQDGFTPLDSALNELSNWIQFASAYKAAASPLTGYSVEWVESPNQGALLALFTFEGETPPVTALLASTLGATTATAAAVAPVDAAMAAALAPATAAATGAALAQGTVSASLDAATLASSATLGAGGTTAATLGAASLSAAGTQQQVSTGTTTAQLDAVTGEATGSVVIAAILTRPLAPVTALATAAVPVAAAVAGLLGDVVATVFAGQSAVGSVDAMLDPAQCAAAGVATVQGPPVRTGLTALGSRPRHTGAGSRINTQGR